MLKNSFMSTTRDFTSGELSLLSSSNCPKKTASNSFRSAVSLNSTTQIIQFNKKHKRTNKGPQLKPRTLILSPLYLSVPPLYPVPRTQFKTVNLAGLTAWATLSRAQGFTWFFFLLHSFYSSFIALHIGILNQNPLTVEHWI